MSLPHHPSGSNKTQWQIPPLPKLVFWSTAVEIETLFDSSPVGFIGQQNVYSISSARRKPMVVE